MKFFSRHLLSLGWVFTVAVCGVLIFTKGFLLKRLVVEKNSTCEVDFTTRADHHGADGCWMHTRFQKAVIIIIDALRFDFAYYNSSIPKESELPYQNKLPVFDEMMRRKPHNARLYKFIADPPTTTMQRLKGLTTGSLPTFVDAGANFAKFEINEDNFIDQMLSLGKRITFMGDDTWEGLFPNRFHKSFAFPSLVVHDLHTVDNGVLKHLAPELKNKDWDLLIGHFLGVDHCGHRYGPNHPAMSDKLNQMDKALRSVISNLDDETILFVMGDHGMTKTGDHGGDSQDELEAALFVYSPSFITSSPPQKGNHEVISQIDFVPTLSLLLGLPIPYPNLGTIIPDLFSYCPWWKTHDSKIKQLYHSVKALRLNAHQVHDYIQSNAQLSDEFPYREMSRLNDEFNYCERRIEEVVTTVQLEGDHPELEKELETLKNQYLSYLGRIKGMCQDIWAKFDLISMFTGLCLVFVSLGSAVFFMLNPARLVFGFLVSMISCLVTVLVYISVSRLSVVMVTVTSANLVILIFSFVSFKVITSNERTDKSSKSKQKTGRVNFIQIIPVLCVLLYAGSMFSNSYVVYEDRVAAFLLLSLLFNAYFSISYNIKENNFEVNNLGPRIKGKSKGKFDVLRLLTSPRCLLFGVLMFCGIIIRLLENFKACREEQHGCENSIFIQPLSALTETVRYLKNARYFFSVCCICLLYYCFRRGMQYYGNLNGFSLSVTCVRYVQPVIICCMSFYWALQALPSKVFDQLPTWQLTMFPQIIYICVVFNIVVLILSPLSLFLLLCRNETPQFMSHDDILPKMFNHIKLNWRKHFNKDHDQEKPPMVYGLATVFSAAQVSVITNIALLTVLLLGDGMAATVLLLLVLTILFVELNATDARTSEISDSTGILSPFTLAMIATVGFFATGHQSVITTIRWEAAYHGFLDTHENQIIPAILIVINTFASQILVTLALPLLVIWPYVKGLLIFRYSKAKDLYVGLGGRIGEYSLYENQDAFQGRVFKAMLGYLIFFIFRLLATMGCAALHRRHLMVWKIFAPRFVYEGALFLLIGVLLSFIYLFLVRVTKSLQKWTEQLPEQS